MLLFKPLCAVGSVCLRAAALAGALAAAPLFASANEFRADLEDAILFGKRMALYENGGGPSVQNYRFDRRHTAVGVCQMTDTTWREIAPTVGIDTAKISTAGDASEHQQWQVCWQLHLMRGYDPWTCCNPRLSDALGETTMRRAVAVARPEPKVPVFTVPSNPFLRPARTTPEMVFTERR